MVRKKKVDEVSDEAVGDVIEAVVEQVFGEQKTAAGHSYTVNEKRADGTRIGIVVGAGGEMHEAMWDINGNDVLGGRPGFKIEAVER